MAFNLTSDIEVVGQELFTSSSTQVHQLGTRAVTSDGRVFRYAGAGATTLTVGNIVQSAAEDTTNWENLSIAAAAVGATSITTTTTVTLAANLLASGWVVVTTSAGNGQVFKVKSHPAVTSAVVTFQLEDPIRVALTTGSKIDVIPNPYNSVVQNPTSVTGNIVGSVVYPINSADYGWIQTHGPAPVLSDTSTVKVGQLVVASSLTAGAVGGSSSSVTGTSQIVGNAIEGIASAENGLVFLTID